MGKKSSKKPFVDIDNGIKCESRVFKTYTELKRNIHGILERNSDSEITVTRTKRGEWGQWFEKWKLIGNKPTIVKSGWL